MRSDHAVPILEQATDAVLDALSGHMDWGSSGVRGGQYASDLVADRAALEVLNGAGLRVLSEESGLGPGTDGDAVVVIDPLDGSTNASRGLPWYATSMCLVDSEGPRAAVVHDHVSGRRYAAERGAGATCDGASLSWAGAPVLADAIIGLNGVPPGHGGWAQFRCLGAVALDLCAVAEGRLDGYVDFTRQGHGVWDYAGAMLVCREVGVEVSERDGLDLVPIDHGARRRIVVASEPLHSELVAMQRELAARPQP